MMFQLLFLLLLISADGQHNLISSKSETDDFSFVHKGIRYAGFIDLPKGKPKAIIVLIPGSGKTDFLGDGGFGKFFMKKREEFLSLGYGVCAWDKQGCGQSEGEFSEDVSLDKSVELAIRAINELKNKQIEGSDKIGLWGLSRGGWVCPLIIEKYPEIAFWISVSGADKYDNFRYLLKTNFRLEGRSESEVDILLKEWDYRMMAFRSGKVTYRSFIASTKHLYSDPLYQRLGEKIPSREDYQSIIKYFHESNEVFDKESGLRIMLPEFDKVLQQIKCPVLAIMGEKDSQINWNSTQNLYKSTLSENLEVLPIPNCNHLMMKCKTGAMFEDLSSFKYELCDEYYEGMKAWLKKLEI